MDKAHKPLVTRAVFEAVQSAPTTYGPRNFEHPAMLAKLASCGFCGSPLTRGSAPKRVTARRTGTRTTCVRAAATAWSRSARLRWTSTSSRLCWSGSAIRRRSARAAAMAATSKRSRRRLSRRSSASTFVRVASAIVDESALAEGLRVRQEAVDEKRAALAEAVRRERSSGRSITDVIEVLENGDDGQRNLELRNLIASLTVQKSRQARSEGDLRSVSRWCSATRMPRSTRLRSATSQSGSGRPSPRARRRGPSPRPRPARVATRRTPRRGRVALRAVRADCRGRPRGHTPWQACRPGRGRHRCWVARRCVATRRARLRDGGAEPRFKSAVHPCFSSSAVARSLSIRAPAPPRVSMWP